MIRYSKDSSLTLLYWWGGIFRHLWFPTFMYWLYLLCSYYLTHWLQFELIMEKTSVHALGGFVMFLFVFRLNQCMARHAKGNELSSSLFSDLEVFMQTFCTCTRSTSDLTFDFAVSSGGDGEEAQARRRMEAEFAITSKINCIRLALAVAVSFVAHLWILDAAAGTQGELEEQQLCHVMFLLVRLEGLLYPEELQLMDEALCITKEWSPEDPACDAAARSVPPPVAEKRAAKWLRAASTLCKGDPEPVFRAETNRHRLDARVVGERVVGQYSPFGEMSVIPLPKIAVQLLLDSVLQTSNLKWGYPERVSSYFVTTVAGAANKIEELSRLVSQPLPLAYMQHCMALLLLYSMVYPLSIPNEEGLLENVGTPLFVFSTLYGFSILSRSLENPLGLDEMDLNMLGMVHSLEVAAEYAFNLSEAGKKASRTALRRPLKEFGMRVENMEPWRARVPVGSFSKYFCWQPIPTLILADVSLNHGHVDTVHQANFHGHSVRRLLRRSLIRRRRHEGGLYHQLGESGDVDVIGDMRRDPMLWCHFLTLRRGPPDADGQDGIDSREGRRPWSTRMATMLQGTPAGAMFEHENGDSDERQDDTERSVLMQTPRAEAHWDVGPGSAQYSCASVYPQPIRKPDAAAGEASDENS